MADILLVSTADWSNPYWTNKQHMAVQLAKRGHRIFYVESQGLRAPTATAKDLRRIWKRLVQGLRPPKEVSPNIFVFSPIVLPFHGKDFIRRLNQIILKTSIGFWCWTKNIKPTILWTYSPLTTEFYDLDKYKLSVYHAVDDIKAQPGMPKETIQRAEANLSSAVDIIFTTAPNLQDFHSKFNSQTFYFSNVADFDHFHGATAAQTRPPADILSIPGPRIGFIGAISSYKLDFGLIRQIALAHPQWSFVFVGEIGEGDPLTDSSDLKGVDNLHFLGGQPYSLLPAYLKAMDVVIMPNRINDYTKSMFPMKFFEYLAAGKPVVSTQLPALADYKDVAAFCDTPEEFATAIEVALAGNAAPLEDRLHAARQQTYDIRTDKMWAIVEQALANKPLQDR